MMRLLHNIGPRINSNYNTPEEISACDDLLSFDGVYLNVYENQHVLLGKKVGFFVMGNYVGGDNSFDKGQKLEKYCSWEQIHEMAKNLNAWIGWHGWAHKDLTQLSDNEVRREIKPPFPMTLLAYPYGKVDARVEAIAREMGYLEAWSVGAAQGADGSDLRQFRSYLNW